MRVKVLAALVAASGMLAQDSATPSEPEPPAAKPAPETAAAKPATPGARADVNLLGRTNAASGEARRNENVQFNLIDNNALKERNMRMGTTASLYDEFSASRRYFGSEFGNPPSSLIHLSTSRSSAWHGSLSETHGNSVFNARSFFTVGSLPPAHENQYGFTVSGPIWRNGRISLDGSQQRIRGNVNGNVLVPKADERTPLTTDPERRAIVQRILDAYPAALPNRTDINERALNTNATQRINDDTGGARIDQRLDSRNNLVARYNFTRQKVDAFQLIAGQNPDTTTRVHTAQLGFSRTQSAATVIDATALFDRVASLLVAEPNAVGPAASFGNVIEKLGPSSFIPIDRVQNRYRYAVGLRQTRSAHNWSAGAEATRRQLNGFEASSHRGTLQFRNDFGRDALTNFLLGIPNRFSGSTGNVHRGFRDWQTALYAGDSFRAAPGLTLSYGLRWETVSAPVEVNDLNRAPFDADRNNLSPRFGFAWRMPASLGVIRGAYGVHYGEIFAITFQQLRYNQPLNQKFEIQRPDLVAAFTTLNVPVDPAARAAAFDITPDLATPYSHQYNLVWEPLAVSGWKFQLGYVGSRSHKLFMLLYTNRAAIDSALPLTTATITDRRPNARYHDFRRIVNGSHGYFDAGRATAILPRWRGLSLEASYWISKAIDTGAGYTNTGTGEDGRQSQSQTETDAWADIKGASVFDQRHAVLLRSTFATPRWNGSGLAGRIAGNWELSSIVLLKTGTPFSVLTGSDGPGFGNVDGDQGDRPHLLDASVLGRVIGHPDTSRQLLPREAFAYLQPGDRRGNLGSNTFRKDGISNVNASLSRSFTAGGDRKVTFRAEALNFLNTPQFAEPTKELTSPSFGFITNTLNDGRAFRMSLRFGF
ncbi:MAG: TonB-dependent receptor [Bryobacteraceae bacterium]